MMRQLFLVLSLLFFAIQSTDACTNLLVGKGASTDGSTMISYSADSYYLFGALYHYPAKTYPKDTKLDIYEWDTGKYLGQILQVRHTYNVIGNMNEHQVSIGETTYVGRKELIDTTGLIDYGSLMYIALQRSRTAREAIKIMTNLVDKYGYYSSGESFSIADPNEVWIMEMIGKGVGNKGAVWVALRMPDEYISAHANQARITTIPFDDKENCMYAKDVVSFARQKGYYSGSDEEFSFSDTYAPLDYGGLRLCEARVWSFFEKNAPDMRQFITYVKGETKERMPLWVKPVKKLSVRDMQNFMRDQYEGTEFDMLQGVAAGDFHTKLRHSPLSFQVDSVEYMHERPIATQQTGFTFVAQMRRTFPDYIGGILWFGVDDAASTVYSPIYCCTNVVPHCLREDNGSLLEYSPTSSFWIFNQVANFSYGKYNYMMEDVKKVQSSLESQFEKEIGDIDQKALKMPETEAVSFLTQYSNEQATTVANRWKKLGEYLLVKYLDGNIKSEDENGFRQNEKHIPHRIIRVGYSEEMRRKIAKENPDLRVKSQKEIDKRK